ncbi:Retrotransposon gag domain [Sesbania bispinosa]|nr:Retrotransposon gag domain [Sesbania bispinosa]
MTRGRSVGSPPLAWGEFSRLFMARFLPESVREGLAHEFERLEQTEEEMRVKRFVRGLREYIFRSVVRSNSSTFAEVLSLALQLEQRQKEKGGSGRDSRKKQGLRDRRVGISQVTRGRSVGSPPLAWGEFSRLFMARFLPESVREGLALEFERLEQTEGMSVPEYNARFTQLSRHAPYPITEEMRLEQRQKEKGGSGRDSRKKQMVEGSQSWHIAGLRDIKAVELASFQLEGVAYDSFDTMTHGRSVGSPPLAWGEFSRLFMARFLPESVREGLAHEFERLEQTEGMSVSEYNTLVLLNFLGMLLILSQRRCASEICQRIEGHYSLSSEEGKEAVAEILAKTDGEGSQSWHIAVGSPPLAWGEFSRLFMARFLPESVREGLAHEFERLEQTEGDARQEICQRTEEYIFRSVVRSNSSTFAEVLSLALQLEQRQKEKGAVAEILARNRGDTQLDHHHWLGVNSLGYSWLAFFRSVREGLAHEFERLEQTEGLTVLLFAEVLSLALQLEQRQKEKEAVAEILARNRGLRDRRVGISQVGSPPLAWGEFSRLFMARFLPESVREGLAHEFERLEQTEEEMRVKRFVRGLREYIFRSVVRSNSSTFAEVLSLALQLEQRQKERRQWPRFSQEQRGVAHDSFDTVTRGRSVGSPPLAGVSSLVIHGSLSSESVREGLAHEFERLEQTEEEMRVKRFVRGLREYIFRSVVRSNCSTFAEVLSLALQLEHGRRERRQWPRFSQETWLRDRRVGISQVVGSPPLAWGEFSRLFMARFLPESVREGLAHEFERLEQTEAQKEKGGSGRDSRKKQRVEGSQSWHIAGLRDIRAVELASFQLEGVAYDSFDTVTRNQLDHHHWLGGDARQEICQRMREYIFRSVVRSNSSTFAEVLSLALQLEQRQKEKGGSGRDSRKKQRVEGSQSWHIAVTRSWITTIGLGHAPYPITEEMRVKRFVRGLREYIFRSVVRSNCSTFAEVLSLALQLEQRQKEKGGSGRDSRKKQRVEGSQSWHIAGLRDIRAVELASFQLEGVAYDSFDTVTRGRSVGSPPLAWGEFSRLFMARFLPESVREGLAHEFERLEQTEGMSVSEYNSRFTQLSRHAPYPITEEMRVKRFVRGLREYIFRSVVRSSSTFAEVLSLALQLEQRQKEKGGSGRDSRKKQRVEGSQSWHIAGLRDIRAVELASFQLEGVAHDSFDTVTRGRSVGSPPLAGVSSLGYSWLAFFRRVSEKGWLMSLRD